MQKENEVLRAALIEAHAALEAAYIELGKYSRWEISELRLDVIRPALVSAKEVLS